MNDYLTELNQLETERTFGGGDALGGSYGLGYRIGGLLRSVVGFFGEVASHNTYYEGANK